MPMSERGEQKTMEKLYDISAGSLDGKIDDTWGRKARQGRTRAAAEAILRVYLGDDMASVSWDDGGVAYYRCQEDADRDVDGSRAVATIAPGGNDAD